MTELLVVIGIIILLVGLLLPALGKASDKAKATQTLATMQSFAQACESYRQQFGYYPGVVPEATLANDPQISGTENAILALMGGYVREEDVGTASFNGDYTAGWTLLTFAQPQGGTYRIKVNPALVGEGPRVAGTTYAPFFSPKGSELAPVPGQSLASSGGGDPFANDALRLPDLVDGWGQPIILVRSMRSSGPLVGAPDSFAQFAIGSMAPYISSQALGELGRNQDDTSILSAASDPNGTFAQIIRHPAFGAADQPIAGTAKGQLVLISAGKDGVYYSIFDGPGDPGDPVDQIVTLGPQVVEEYDDIRIFGGG